MISIHLNHRVLWTLAFIAQILVNFPAWAQTDAKISFDSKQNGNGSKIYIMNTDGVVTGPIGLLPGDLSAPIFSLNNQKIIFTYLAPGAQFTQIYIMNVDGSGAHALTNDPSSDFSLKFIQGDKIVYEHELHPGSTTAPFTAYYVMESDGSHQVSLPLNDISGYIAYLSVGINGMAVLAGKFIEGDNHDSAQLYTVSITGNGLRRITDSPDTFSTPGWSSDGRKIAYANRGIEQTLPFTTPPQHDDKGGIYVMNVDGGDVHRIVQIDFSKVFGPPTSFGIGPGRDLVSMCSAPSFSPSGVMLTYAVNLGDGCQIYIVNLDGSGLRRLTNPPNTSGHPTFSN